MTVLWTKPLSDITEMFIKKFSGSVSKGKSAVNKKQTNKPDKKKQKQKYVQERKEPSA